MPPIYLSSVASLLFADESSLVRIFPFLGALFYPVLLSIAYCAVLLVLWCVYMCVYVCTVACFPSLSLPIQGWIQGTPSLRDGLKGKGNLGCPNKVTNSHWEWYKRRRGESARAVLSRVGRLQ